MYRKRSRSTPYRPSAGELNANNDLITKDRFRGNFTGGPTNLGLNVINVHNSASEIFKAYSIVKIDDKLLLDLSKTKVPVGNSPGPGGGNAEDIHGVVQKVVRPNRVAFAFLSGVTICRVAGGTGKFGEINGDYVLTPTSAATKYRLLDEPHATDEKLIPVLIQGGEGGGGTESRVFELTQDPTLGTPDGNPPTKGQANLFSNDPEITPLEQGQTIIFPLKMYDDLVAGDCGVCFKNAKNEWIAYDAPDQTGTAVPSPTVPAP